MNDARRERTQVQNRSGDVEGCPRCEGRGATICATCRDELSGRAFDWDDVERLRRVLRVAETGDTLRLEGRRQDDGEWVQVDVTVTDGRRTTVLGVRDADGREFDVEVRVAAPRHRKVGTRGRPVDVDGRALTFVRRQEFEPRTSTPEGSFGQALDRFGCRLDGREVPCDRCGSYRLDLWRNEGATEAAGVCAGCGHVHDDARLSVLLDDADEAGDTDMGDA